METIHQLSCFVGHPVRSILQMIRNKNLFTKMQKTVLGKK